MRDALEVEPLTDLLELVEDEVLLALAAGAASRWLRSAG